MDSNIIALSAIKKKFFLCSFLHVFFCFFVNAFDLAWLRIESFRLSKTFHHPNAYHLNALCVRLCPANRFTKLRPGREKHVSWTADSSESSLCSLAWSMIRAGVIKSVVVFPNRRALGTATAACRRDDSALPCSACMKFSAPRASGTLIWTFL